MAVYGEYMMEASTKLNNGNVRFAAALFEAANQTAPTPHEAALALAQAGHCYHRCGSYDKAIGRLTEATATLRTDGEPSDYATALRELAIAYLKRNVDTDRKQALPLLAEAEARCTPGTIEWLLCALYRLRVEITETHAPEQRRLLSMQLFYCSLMLQRQEPPLYKKEARYAFAWACIGLIRRRPRW